MNLNQAFFLARKRLITRFPNPQIGAYMIESPLGRRKSLALLTISTGLATFAFTAVETKVAVIASSMLISLTGTGMYAVLCKCAGCQVGGYSYQDIDVPEVGSCDWVLDGMTPEIFDIHIRGTACGTSAALSRL